MRITVSYVRIIHMYLTEDEPAQPNQSATQSNNNVQLYTIYWS